MQLYEKVRKEEEKDNNMQSLNQDDNESNVSNIEYQENITMNDDILPINERQNTEDDKINKIRNDRNNKNTNQNKES